MTAALQHEPRHWTGREENPLNLDHIVELRRADLFERVLISRLTTLGEQSDEIRARSFVLASAILFGALLDKRVWNEFIRVSCSPVLDFRSIPPEHVAGQRHVRIADRSWLNLSLPERNGKPQHRRWAADPLTHLLLLRFQNVGQQLSEERLDELASDMPAVLAHAFGAASWPPDRQEALAESFYAAAEIKWRTRMPGFLIENLLETGQSTSLPEPNWERLIGNPAVPLKLQKKPYAPKQRWPARDPILRLIDEVLPQSRASRPIELKKSAQALQDASRTNDLVPVERYVLMWAAARLNPQIDPRQRRRSLAPSTIRQRAATLIAILRAAFDDRDPWLLSPTDLAAALTDSVEAKGGGHADWSHMACFLDWQSRSVGSLAMSISGQVAREASAPRAHIVTGNEYASILESFDRQRPEGLISRILVILGFRAGLRWQEAIHLHIDDFLFADPCAELQIRDNEGARTKTPAGRRVVPLHSLLEPHELDEVRAWWLHRRIEIRTRKGGQHRRRDRSLFPKANDEQHRRIKQEIEHEIKRFTGNKEAVFHDLRHSFGSYLIATLALPFDVPDDALVLPIDPSVISHERRQRIAATLLGSGRHGLNGLHAVGALLGHSGERSTLVSYFHLHDWLAANYVSRPEAMRAVPTQLAAWLLAMSDDAVLKASSRARHEPRTGQVIRRKRGRPPGGNHALGSVVLREFIEKGDKEISRPRIGAIRPPLLPGDGEPGWEVLESYLSASARHERDLVRQHPTLMTPYGKRLVAELDAIRAMVTNGRRGRSSRRFADVDLAERKRAVRRLTNDEREVLITLYNGFRCVDPQVMEVVSECFLHGYDRVRGYISAPQIACPTITNALITAGLTNPEISVEHRARSALIRLGAFGRMHRGYIWGLLFLCAAHRASRSILRI